MKNRRIRLVSLLIAAVMLVSSRGMTTLASDNMTEPNDSAQLVVDPTQEDATEDVADNTADLTDEGQENDSDVMEDQIEQDADAEADTLVQSIITQMFTDSPAYSYSITYNLDGGTNHPDNPMGYEKSSKAIALKNPTKAGYTFKGWYTTKTFKTKVTSIAAKSTGDKVFYAKWDLTKYTITYAVNGGKLPKGMPTAFTIEDEQPVIIENENLLPTKKGYDFGGWYEDKACNTAGFVGEKVTQIPGHSTDNRTIYAQWIPIKYHINYHLNPEQEKLPAEEWDLSDKVTQNEANLETYTIEQKISLQAPTRTGYTFKGWYTTDKYKTKVTTIAKGTTGDKEYFAKWALTPYTITYKLNGGKNPKGTITSFKVTSDEIPLGVPTRTGYTFEGWYGTSDFRGERISSIPAKTSTNVTLYAKWSETPYEVFFNLNGEGADFANEKNEEDATVVVGYEDIKLTQNGEDSEEKTTLCYKKDFTITSPTFKFPSPVREGYTFGGWYTTTKYKTKVTQVKKGSYNTRTYYAKWNPISYKITYNYNGGTAGKGTVTKYTKESDILLVPPTKAGYDFKGWYPNADLSGDEETKISLGSMGARNFYAKWEEATYNIDYHLNGGIFEEITPQIQVYGSSSDAQVWEYKQEYKISWPKIVLPNAIKESHTFAGWYTEPTFKNKVTVIKEGSYGNKKLYAKWTPYTYKLAFNANGGSGKMNAKTGYQSGKIYNIPVCTFTKKGYFFTGWDFEGSYGEEADYPEQFSHSPITNGETLELYAHWEMVTYPITYVLNAGKDICWNEDNMSSYTYDETLDGKLTVNNPTRTGYQFVGWYTDSTFKNRLVSSGGESFIPTGSAKALKLYAKWVKM